MKRLFKYFLLMVFCLSAYIFTSCADTGYVVAYEPTPTIYYYSYPNYHYYAPPRRVYPRPNPPQHHRPVVAPKPYPKQNGHRPNTGNRGGNRGHGRK